MSGFVKSMFEASDADPWNGCEFHVAEVRLCRDHFAWQLIQEFVCLGWKFFAGRNILKHPHQNRNIL